MNAKKIAGIILIAGGIIVAIAANMLSDSKASTSPPANQPNRGTKFF